MLRFSVVLSNKYVVILILYGIIDTIKYATRQHQVGYRHVQADHCFLRILYPTERLRA